LLTKILFTLAVILVVALVFRVKNTPAKPAAAAKTAPNKGGVSAAMVAYTLLALVIAISALAFVLHWQDQHRVIDIQVSNSQGQVLKYQAYKKTIEGRRFTTIDGVSVDLADSDRIEILETPD
jgi:glucose dehydrogenase